MSCETVVVYGLLIQTIEVFDTCLAMTRSHHIFFSIDDDCLERLDRMRPGSVDADFQPCRGRLGFGRREEKERKKWRLSVFSSYLVKPEYSLISTTCLSKQIKLGHFSLSLSLFLIHALLAHPNYDKKLVFILFFALVCTFLWLKWMRCLFSSFSWWLWTIILSFDFKFVTNCLFVVIIMPVL